MGSNFRNYINSFVFDTELPGSGVSVSFRPVTTGQIKKLLLYETSEDPLSIESALDDMITECVVKPENFDIRKQFIQDRFYLLVEIRKATRGATYNFQTICTSCASQTQQAVNLSDLTVTKLNKAPTKVVIEEKKEPVVVTTKPKKGKLVEKEEEEIKPKVVVTKPLVKSTEWDVVQLNDNISIRLKLVTREMQQLSYDIFKEKHKDQEVGEIEKTIDITTTLYALAISGVITPEGEESDLPLEERIFLLNNIQQSEQDKISKWFDDNDFGIDFSFDVKCKHCNFTERRAVPVENFFY